MLVSNPLSRQIKARAQSSREQKLYCNLYFEVLFMQRERLEAQWAQSVAALLLELPKVQRAYTAATFDRYTPSL